MLIDQATAAHWMWAPEGSALAQVTDLVVDLRPARVREQFPMPGTWSPTEGYASETEGWRLDAMWMSSATEEQPRACSGFWRFSGPDGFRFVVAVCTASNTGDLPTGALAEMMPSLRMVLTARTPQLGRDALVHTEEPAGAWEYNLNALSAAVRDPHAWFGMPSPTAWRARAGFLVSLTQAKTLLTWSLVGATRAEAGVWTRAGFSPVDVGKWTHPTRRDPWKPFTAEQARAWSMVAGAKEPKRAHWWRTAGFTAAEAAYWEETLREEKRRLIPARVFGDERVWARIVDRDRRWAYMQAGFAAEEAARLEETDPPDLAQIEVLSALKGSLIRSL